MNEPSRKARWLPPTSRYGTRTPPLPPGKSRTFRVTNTAPTYFSRRQNNRIRQLYPQLPPQSRRPLRHRTRQGQTPKIRQKSSQHHLFVGIRSPGHHLHPRNHADRPHPHVAQAPEPPAPSHSSDRSGYWCQTGTGPLAADALTAPTRPASAPGLPPTPFLATPSFHPSPHPERSLQPGPVLGQKACYRLPNQLRP